MRFQTVGVVCLLLATAGSLCGQDSMSFAAAATSKFVNLPGLPTCMTVAVQQGDPTKGPSVLLLKFTPGCAVPWHWHTASEQLMIVSGNGKAEMKDGKPMAVKSGDFLFLPGKNIHQFTAVSSVMLFDLPSGAFDIHYVDPSGNEIPPEQALKPMKKASPKPAAKKPA